MNTIHNKIVGDLVVTSNTIIHGLIDGNVSVKDGASLILHGLIDGDLTIETGSICEVHGRIEKNIVNKGKCTIYGIVEGSIFSSLQSIRVNEGAIVNNILPHPAFEA
jgi:cytoskeletal protein CcmA (bactofilin family)